MTEYTAGGYSLLVLLVGVCHDTKYTAGGYSLTGLIGRGMS